MLPRAFITTDHTLDVLILVARYAILRVLRGSLPIDKGDVGVLQRDGVKVGLQRVKVALQRVERVREGVKARGDRVHECGFSPRRRDQGHLRAFGIQLTAQKSPSRDRIAIHAS